MTVAFGPPRLVAGQEATGFPLPSNKESEFVSPSNMRYDIRASRIALRDSQICAFSERV